MKLLIQIIAVLLVNTSCSETEFSSAAGTSGGSESNSFNGESNDRSDNAEPVDANENGGITSGGDFGTGGVNDSTDPSKLDVSSAEKILQACESASLETHSQIVRQFYFLNLDRTVKWVSMATYQI